MSLEVQEFAGAAGIEMLRDPWEALLAETGETAPFLTPDWFACCVAGFGEGKQPLLIAVIDSGRLVAVAPLWVTRARVRGIDARRLEFICSPDSAMVDFVVAPDLREAALQAILEHLDQHRDDWDLVDLERWPAASENQSLVERCWRDRGGKTHSRLSSHLPVIPIETDWAGYLASRSQKYRKTNRNIANRMARLGAVTVEHHTEDPAGEILAETVALSARSWKQQQGVAIASRADFGRFFEALTPLAARRGWLQIWLARIDGRVVAMEYDLAWEGRVFALRADYDQDYREQSPGAFLQFSILEHLFRNAYREYNTGPGATPYKLHMADRSVENRAVTLFRRNLAGTALWALEGALLPWARRLRHDVAGGRR